jgi:hypothetical protein
MSDLLKYVLIKGDKVILHDSIGSGEVHFSDIEGGLEKVRDAEVVLALYNHEGKFIVDVLKSRPDVVLIADNLLDLNPEESRINSGK